MRTAARRASAKGVVVRSWVAPRLRQYSLLNDVAAALGATGDGNQRERVTAGNQRRQQHPAQPPQLPMTSQDQHAFVQETVGSTVDRGMESEEIVQLENSEDRKAFYEAIRNNDVASAWSSYVVSTGDSFDKYMVSSLVLLIGRRKRPRLLAQIWRSVHERAYPVSLDAHLASSFIRAFSANHQLTMSLQVVEIARAEGIATTRVLNSYLAAVNRAATTDDPVILGLVDRILEQMESPEAQDISPDAFTLSLVVSIFGRTGRVDDAKALVERWPSRMDTVALNTLMDVVGRAGDVHYALKLLEQMERDGPPPDEASYTSALQALVRAPTEGPNSVDRIAMAQELRERMGAHGVVETAAIRTSLLSLFSDTSLGEAFLLEGAPATWLNPGQEVPDMPSLPDDVRFVTDLRGLTRQAVSIALRLDLQQTGEAREQGIGACASSGGYGGSWAIVTGTPEHVHAVSDAAGGEAVDSGRASVPKPEPVTVNTAVAFLETEGIEFTKSRGLLVVDEGELERVAAEAATRSRRERVQQALLLQFSVIASGLAATSLVPKLLGW